ncbi:MAG: MerR family transcriptional regulator [Bacillota bacterium]
MKIGQLAKKFNISVDNIRYYIQIGLIIPEKKQKQFYFGKKSIEEIELILRLKELHFTLKEIHQILSVRRISNLVDEQDIMDIINIYESKKVQLHVEKANIEQVILEIDRELENISSHKVREYEKTGVPLNFISYLYCPNCDIPLSLKNVEMNYRYIFEGDLLCGCGYHATIKDGIIITKNRSINPYDKPDLERELYKDIPASLISLFQRSYNWMLEKLKALDLKNKIVLETHINAYFFIHNHIKEMEKDALYIVIDKFPEMLAMYKRKIERLNLGSNILYIADNSTSYPIKKGSIDLFIDYFGTNEHCIYNHSYLLSDIKSFFSSQAAVIGTFFYFDPFSASIRNLCNRYPEAYRHNFDIKYYKNSLSEAGFIIDDDEAIGYIIDSGDNRAFSFHKEGERMYLYSFDAKRKV